MDGEEYYIIKVDDDTIKLAATYDDAEDEIAVDIDSDKIYPGVYTIVGPLKQTIVVNTFTLFNYPNPRDYYHVFLANTVEWSNEPTPDAPVDSRSNDALIKRNILGVKRVNPSDTCLMVRRIDWEAPPVPENPDFTQGVSTELGGYDRYDDAVDISGLNFYVFNSSNYRIYKCLNNNNGNFSTAEPNFSEVGPKTLSDGYTWQLIYEVPAADRVKFLTDELIPIRFYGTSTQFDHNGTISEIVVQQTGSGYTSTPNVQILGDGNGATAEAVLDAGSLENINLTNGGAGYSFAFVQITGGGGSGASAYAVIETTDLPNVINQNVAGYAVATTGQLDLIDVIDSGDGYTQQDAKVRISGDGSGATATAVVADGKIISVKLTDRGSGYTFALVEIIGENETTASARAVISPQGGHGSNIPQELFATTLGITVNVEDFQEDFFLNNDFRQYGLIKNIRAYNSNLPFNETTGNACVVITVPAGDYGKYNNDDIISTSGGGRYRVAALQDSNYTVYLQPIINNIEDNFNLINETTSEIMTSPDSIDTLALPEISQNSGDVIYFVNSESLDRQSEQNENIKFYINF
jgi:hypothetical protein